MSDQSYFVSSLQFIGSVTKFHEIIMMVEVNSSLINTSEVCLKTTE